MTFLEFAGHLYTCKVLIWPVKSWNNIFKIIAYWNVFRFMGCI